MGLHEMLLLLSTNAKSSRQLLHLWAGDIQKLSCLVKPCAEFCTLGISPWLVSSVVLHPPNGTLGFWHWGFFWTREDKPNGIDRKDSGMGYSPNPPKQTDAYLLVCKGWELRVNHAPGDKMLETQDLACLWGLGQPEGPSASQWDTPSCSQAH